MKKALIKKTGELFDVKIEYKWSKGKGLTKVTSKEKEDYYVLSNGITYIHDDIILGIDEIREWKLKNVIYEKSID